MKKVLFIFLTLAMAAGIIAAGAVGASAAGDAAKLAATAFPTESLIVADVDVSEIEIGGRYVDPTGNEDATDFIQAAIDACAAGGGGTVWLPKGEYRITRGIDVKVFVTLRGDWRNPDIVSDGDYGTLIIADVPSDTAKYPGLFRIRGNAGCMGLTVWYPNQRLDSVLPYPYTFESPGGRSGWYDTMMSTVKNCTLLNSYRGAGISLHNYEGDWGDPFGSTHEMYNVSGLYGTVLETGLAIHDSSDVDVVEFVNFDNKYWLAAGASFNAPEQADLDAYTLANTTAFEISALDWTQFTGLHARGYQKGIRLIYTKRTNNDVAIAYSRFLDCATAVSPEEPPELFTDAYSVLLTRCTLEGSVAAVGDSETNQCIRLVDCEVTGELNGAFFEYTGLSPAALEHQAFNEHKPAQAVLYDVSQPPYNAPRTLFNALPTLNAASDIQQALDDAGAAGGGLVYLPAGWYRIEANLTVPAGVELRGSSSVPIRDNHGSSEGTVLMVYQGKDTGSPLTDTACITLGSGAGLSGLRILYPENTFFPPHAYPFAVRGHGSGVYVTNVCMVNCDRGVDLPDCPDHFVRRLVGMAWHGMVRVGGGAGKIEACLGNATFMDRNGFNIPGWPDASVIYMAIFTDILMKSEVFVEINGAVDEKLMNIFMYGGKTTVHVRAGSATVINAGADGLGGPPIAADPGASLKVVNLMTYCPGADPNPPRVEIFNSHRRDYKYQPNFWDNLDDYLVEHIPWLWVPVRDFFVNLWKCIENMFANAFKF
ncbi:MAG: glycoside hydrolase family 55 protein [Oscillospiraceae bacterium]|nr:glycoside hydrolase family 55 protein [Oscillospiraceae bacterium]